MSDRTSSTDTSLLKRLGRWFKSGDAATGRRAATTALDVDEAREWLRGVLAARLELPPEQIDTARNFEEYGLDSRTAVGVSGELEEWLGKPLSPTLLWDCPSIDAVAAYLAEAPEATSG